ncbi:hypothetical protein [Thalassomonas actiniarum]|uniref:Uncharacterized protein n=1 Tax=Thalassomonas actiniarum TaxID=485447 RepID=A0AAE9YWR2_9GAMM|nr:hypothetical protein [Thalassomonas actiniarum]WDE02601.1 hypothetical protein SG35_029805 [Thalassomonas actiniarum]
MLSFEESIKSVLEQAQGISIESEGSIYVRSTEGNNYFAGHVSSDGAVSEEVEFGSDIDKAISYFMSERKKKTMVKSTTFNLAPKFNKCKLTKSGHPNIEYFCPIKHLKFN